MKSEVLVYILLMIMFAAVECVIDFCDDNVAEEKRICTKRATTDDPLTDIPFVRYNLTSIEMSSEEIKELPYDSFRIYNIYYNITIISLINCGIERVDADAFLNLYHLKRLDLTQNKISHLDGKTFQHLKQIQKISINNNMIKVLSEGLYNNLFSLEIVEMYSNLIELIEPGTFKNVPLLSHLDLGDNNLQYLDESVVQSFETISNFYLHDNPWTCDCNLLKLRDLFSKVLLTSDGQLPKCENPVELRGKSWKDLSNDEFQCDVQILVPNNNSEVVLADTNITLTCKAYAYSKLDMKWYKNSVMIEPQYLTRSSSSDMHYLYYTFTVDEYSAGEYFCIVTNSKRRQKSSITLGVYRRTKKPIEFSLVGTINISGSLRLTNEDVTNMVNVN